MRKTRLLYALAGAGAGNITRALAVIEELARERFELAFVAQGRSRELAPAGMPLYALRDITYGQGAFTAWNVLRHNLSFPIRYWQNRHACARAVDEFRPDLVVVDSDFHCFGVARERRIPVVSINSSEATVELLRRSAALPANLFFSYHGVEKVDCWLQRRNADLIICPVIEPIEVKNPRVRQIPPIVRRQFLGRPAAPPAYDVVVMLSGSGIGTSDIDLNGVAGSMLILGGAPEGRYPASVRRLPFTPEPAAYLSQARVVVIQGGFNSVSEVIALRKPAVVVPIARHAEQFVNACAIERLGIGLAACGREAGRAVQAIFDRYDEVMALCRALPLPCDGAARAARLIEEMGGG